MPIPIFFIEFKQEHARNPLPHEMTVQERAALLECCLFNRNQCVKNAFLLLGLREIAEAVDKDPNAWFDLLESEPNLERRAELENVIATKGIAFARGEVQRQIEQLETLDCNWGYWDKVMHESVGLRGGQ